MTEGWLSERGSRLANVTIDALTMVSFLALLGTLIQAAVAAGDAYRRHQMATDFLNARAQLLREATSWACITLASGVAFLNALMRG